MTVLNLPSTIDSRKISPGEVCGDKAPVSSENSFSKQHTLTYIVLYISLGKIPTIEYVFNKATEAFLNSSEIILSDIFCLFLKFLGRGIKEIACRISRG